MGKVPTKCGMPYGHATEPGTNHCYCGALLYADNGEISLAGGTGTKELRLPPTVLECVGGCADGTLLDVSDPTEPDDVPDGFRMAGPGGAWDDYCIRTGPGGMRMRAVVTGGRRTYFYDAVR